MAFRQILGLSLALTLLLAACGGPQTTGSTGAQMGGGLSGEQNCAWSQSRGGVPPEVEAEAQQQFAATGIPGTLLIIGHGENNSCDGFHLSDLQYEFAISVDDFADEQNLTALSARLQELPGQLTTTQTNMMPPRIRFETATQYCWWQETVCGPVFDK